MTGAAGGFYKAGPDLSSKSPALARHYERRDDIRAQQTPPPRALYCGENGDRETFLLRLKRFPGHFGNRACSVGDASEFG
jgi:hypothetical protein